MRAALHNDPNLAAKVDARRTALDALCASHEPGDVALLEDYLAEAYADAEAPTFTLFVRHLEQFAAAPLQDFLEGALAWAMDRQHTTGVRPFSLVLVYTASLPVLPRARMPAEAVEASHWLSAHLAHRVLARTDAVEVVLPDKTAFWERVVCALFLQPSSRVWLGRSVFELVRRRYWHVESSWESVAQVVRLAYVHHFTTVPLSAFVYTLPTHTERAKHWTSELDDTARLAAVSTHMAGSNDTPSLPSTLHAYLRDVDQLWTDWPAHAAQLHVASAWRVILLTVVQSLLSQAHMNDMHGTRLSYSACVAASLTWAAPHTDWNAGRMPAYALTPTTPSLGQLRTLIGHLAGTMQATDLAVLLPTLQTQLHAQAADLHPAGSAAFADAVQGLNSVQSQRDDPGAWSTAFVTWVTDAWTAMLDMAPSGLSAVVWTYDFAEPLSSALEGAARAGTLLALDAPSETVAALYASAAGASGQALAAAYSDWPERAMGVSDVDELRAVLAELEGADPPDVCRLFSLYKDSGKFINLADWFDAFRQSLEGSARATGNAVDMDEDALQVRFALAINELAYLGLLGPTGRKVEHVCRMVWDLPIEGMPGA